MSLSVDSEVFMSRDNRSSSRCLGQNIAKTRTSRQDIQVQVVGKTPVVLAERPGNLLSHRAGKESRSNGIDKQEFLAR